MRLASATIALTLLASLARASAEESFPFTAYVANDRTQARSGPGDDHYATDQLGRGAKVEVHQRTTRGWLAIRPPSTSFSWVAQRDVEFRDERSIAHVTGSTAVSWIGSNIETVNDHKWLVKLDPGEPLSILGQERRKVVADGKSDLYYKIAPPAGEFRWLHEDDIVRSEEELKRDSQVELADFRVALRDRTRSKPATTEAAKKDDFVGRRGELPAARNSTADVARLEQPDPNKKPEPLIVDEQQTDSRIRELDGRLSLIVAQSVDKWDFGTLRTDAEQVAARATSTLERARVQVFLDKVADFETLKSRHATFAAPTETRPAASAGSSKSLSKSTAATDELDPRFDGTGWLLPVHSTKRAAPPYALLDNEGNILQFVSPAPGLNLNRYLRKEIGVFGQKQQAATLDKPHLTAHRIVELNRHRR